MLQFFSKRFIQDNQLGACTYIKEVTSEYHTHDYYELFLITRGSGKHITQDGTTFVSYGTIGLVRYDHCHCFETDDCEMFNLIITKELWNELAVFLEGSTIFHSLANTTSPIQFTLPRNEAESIIRLFESFLLFPRIDEARYNSHLKAVVITTLEKFFIHPHTTIQEYPQWMDSLVIEMQKPENFKQGIQKLYDISGYAPEYICRSFKKYLHTTPTQFINQLRIQQASKELIYTNTPVIEIASNTGFETLSHFYHVFKSVYHVSPRKYRVQYQITNKNQVL